MDSGVILRNTRLVNRDGFIIELRDSDKIGRGEISPLPGCSLEVTDEAGAQAKTILASWLSGESIAWSSLYPSVAFGVSMALAELTNELPLTGNYLGALLCNSHPDDLMQVLAEMSGQKVAKIKVGLHEAIRDGMIVNMFLKAIPDLTLRLDANRQWTVAKAAQFAKHVNMECRSRIAFIEEPCQTIRDSLVFSQGSGIALAWDETLRDNGFFLKPYGVLKAIIIKPTLIGSLSEVKSLVTKAHEMGLDVVISSSLETSIGLNQLARLAQWLTPATIPGLDTINLFSTQLEIPWPNCTLPIMSLSDCNIVWQQSNL